MNRYFIRWIIKYIQFKSGHMYLSYLSNCSRSKVFAILAFLQYFITIHSILTIVKEIQINNGKITDFQFSQNYSKFITVSSTDNKFIVWNTNTLSQISQKTLPSTINGIGINDATSQIIVLLKNGQVEIYDSTSLTFKSSFAYPNSGYGNQISFISGGALYMMGGLDPGTSPYLHLFDKTHTLIGSVQNTFSVGSQITIIYNVVDAMIFVASNQATAPVEIEMYTLNSGNYVLTKKFTESNGRVNGMSISADGSHFFTVSQDLTLRNYTLSPFNNMFEVTSVVYYQENPLAVNGLVNVVTFVSTSTELIEYFHTGQVSLETHYPIKSAITRIINLFPILLCTTSDGKLVIYSVTFVDMVDKEVTKWVILSSVMGGVVLVLLMGLVLEIRYNKIKQKANEQEAQGLRNEKQMMNVGQVA